MTHEELGDALSWTGDTALIDCLDDALTTQSEEALHARLDQEAAAAFAVLEGRSRQRLLHRKHARRRHRPGVIRQSDSCED